MRTNLNDEDEKYKAKRANTRICDLDITRFIVVIVQLK